jgi:hypothetical protein
MHRLTLRFGRVSFLKAHSSGHQHNRRSLRTNLSVLIVLWLVLLIASLTVLSSVITPFLRSLQSASITSLDWAGYVAISQLLVQQPIVNAVNASWIVPNVAVSAVDSYSAAWIGIGGQSEKTLIQVGTEHDSIRRQAVYSAWYEMLPDNSINIMDMAISPGDFMTASIAKVDPATNDWRIQIADTTTGQIFNQVFAYNSSQLSAEWIVERPTVNNRLETMADFGSVTFTNAHVQLSSTTGTISTFANYAVTMNNVQNAQLAAPSPLTSDGSGFTVTFQRSS